MTDFERVLPRGPSRQGSRIREVLVGTADFHGGLAILERLRERHPGLADIDVMVTHAQQALARQVASAAIDATRVITVAQP